MVKTLSNDYVYQIISQVIIVLRDGIYMLSNKLKHKIGPLPFEVKSIAQAIIVF